MPKISVEVGKYEEGRVIEVEVPEVTYETAQYAYNKGAEELRKLVEAGEMDDDSYVSQLWHGNRCLYDFMNGFGLYWEEFEQLKNVH